MKKLFTTYILFLFCIIVCKATALDSLSVPVTFRVDLSQNSAMNSDISVVGDFQSSIIGAYFNNFEVGVNTLDNVCGEIWQVTYNLPPGNYTYVYYSGMDAEIYPTDPNLNSCLFYGISREFTVEPCTPLILDRYFWGTCETSVGTDVAVTFKVDMNNHLALYNPTIVSIAGNFQAIATNGATADWTAGTTEMTDNDNDGFYEYTALLPEGSYEYKIVAGDNFDFVENTENYYNRVLNVASCDSTFTEEICFSGDVICETVSPINITFKVDMRNETISEDGLFVAGDFQFPVWQKNVIELTATDDFIYEVTLPVLTANYEYKFYNGTDGDPTSDMFAENANFAYLGCGSSNNRNVDLTNTTGDTTLLAYFFNECDIFIPSNIEESIYAKDIDIYPNPVSNFVALNVLNSKISNYKVSLKNIYGKEVFAKSNIVENSFLLQRNNLSSGVYFVNIVFENETIKTQKLIFK